MKRNSEGRKVVIFGAGQLASLAHFYLTHDSPHTVKGFTVDEEYRQDDNFEGLPLIGFGSVTQHFPPEEYAMFLPISFKRMNYLRKEKFEAAKEMRYECISYVSSKATVWPDLDIGENCFIFEDNTIQPFVSIGDNCILWSGNHIGHHSRIGSHVFISSHVVISGACTIEDHVFIGVNACIRDESIIREAGLIGMGAVITKDTEKEGIYIGAKAKKLDKSSMELDSISHKTEG